MFHIEVVSGKKYRMDKKGMKGKEKQDGKDRKDRAKKNRMMGEKEKKN